MRHLHSLTRIPARAEDSLVALQNKLLDAVSTIPPVRNTLVATMIALEESKSGVPEL
ncbi:MAG: hypothetical protein JXO22_04690 [Phycisphaerae bacterium]|nr:hypothetical protein [Phycisphaerae bacterium]